MTNVQYLLRIFLFVDSQNSVDSPTLWNPFNEVKTIDPKKARRSRCFDLLMTFL